MEDYERILLVKPEVFVYKIPPRTTNRGFRAADWKLDAPDWTGRLRVVTKGNDCIVKLEDKMTGELFAMCPVDKYPGIAVESVVDSSRYFVLRIQDGNGRSAFIGIGFADRGDSFDLNVALSDHFKWLQKTEEMEQEKPPDAQPQLDLRFKEGETIKINVNFGKKGTSRPKPKASNPSGTPGILPPPPGGLKLPAPPSARIQGQQSTNAVSPSQTPTAAPSTTTPDSNSAGLLLDFGSPTANPTETSASADAIHQPTGNDLWGDFTNSSESSTTQNQDAQSSSGASWAQF